MKVFLLLAGLCALALAVPTPVKDIPKKYKMDDKVLLEKQMTILKFFKYVQQRSHFKEILEYGKGFHPESHLDMYTEPHYVEELMEHHKYDYLPQGEIFSVFYDEHLEQAKILFKVFYYAKDWETFVKTAGWASEWVNEGLFIYALSVALVHRPDTHGIILPPIHEVNPYFFFNSEVIYKAQRYKQMHHEEYPEEHGYKGYTITANYSGWYLNLDPEQYLSYFTEDIGLNSFYYYYHVYYPFWLDGEEFHLKNDRRGELFYIVHQQLWARYYSERLSHEYDELHALSRDAELPGYYPSLSYPNGLDFPSRPPHTHMDWEGYGYGKSFHNFTGSYYRGLDYSRRIRDAIGLGFVYTHSGQKVSLYTEKGIEIFASILEGSADSPNLDYYGIMQIYVRHVLGHAPTPLSKYHLKPAAVEHYETALRDPAYWQFVKYIVHYFQEYKMHGPHNHYTKQDVYFTDYEIENIHVDRLTTYFEWFYSDLSFGVYYNFKHETEPFHIRARQQRLNHKPFTYTINVQSKKASQVVVRVYIGPKYDSYGREMPFNQNRLNFYLIDKFPYSVKVGKNAIVRNSQQTITVSDKTSYWQLYKRVMGAIKSTEEFVIDGSETYWGLPNRLLLPSGRFGGLPYQFFAIVTPLHEPEGVQKHSEEVSYPVVGTGFKWWYDDYSLGYPFDKPLDFAVHHVPNAHFEDVVIYHKKFEDLNVANHHE